MPEIKERPIIFSGPMVRAILEGKKTQARQVVKPQPTADWGWSNEGTRNGSIIDLLSSKPEIKCPFLKGQRLWVRETWAPFSAWNTDEGIEVDIIDLPTPKLTGKEQIAYKADFNNVFSESANIRWRSPIHMPRWASRITLEIKDIRVERVQDITKKDVKAEGVSDWEEFRELWDKLNARRGFKNRGSSWDKNPYCWVIAFDVVKINGN
jgi:hypothetical protein